MSMNRVTLLGNLGSDPEQKETKDGKPVCVLNLATNRLIKNSEGEKHSQTDWHNIVCFGATATNCGKYLKKGKEILIEGRIETRKWQAKDGSDRVTNQIVATSVHFLGGRESEEQQYDPISDTSLDGIL